MAQSYNWGGGELPMIPRGKIKSHDGLAADKVQKYIAEEIAAMTEQSPASRFRIFRSALGMVIPRLGDFAPVVTRILKEYDGFILTSCLHGQPTSTPSQAAASVEARLATSTVGLRPVEKEEEGVKARTPEMGSRSTASPKPGEMRSFNIALLEGRDFISNEWGVRKDLYLLVSCGKVRHRTQAKGGHLNPVWNEKLITPVYESSSQLQIDVFDRRVSARQPLGSCTIDLFQLQFGSYKELDSLLAVHDQANQFVGSIHVVISEVESKALALVPKVTEKKVKAKLSTTQEFQERAPSPERVEKEKYICSSCNLEKRVNYLKELRWKETNHELVKNIVELKDYVRVFLLEIERLNQRIGDLEGERKSVELQKGTAVLKEQMLQKAHEEFRDLERKVRDDLIVLQKRLMTTNLSGSFTASTSDANVQTDVIQEFHTVPIEQVEPTPEPEPGTPDTIFKLQAPIVVNPAAHGRQYVVLVDIVSGLHNAIKVTPDMGSGLSHELELLTWGNLYSKAVFSPIHDWGGVCYMLPFSCEFDPLGLRALVGFSDCASALMYGIEVIDRCKTIIPTFLPDQFKREGFLRVSMETVHEIDSCRERDNCTGRFYLKQSKDFSKLIYSNRSAVSAAVFAPTHLLKEAAERCKGVLMSRPYSRTYSIDHGDISQKYSYAVSTSYQSDLPHIEAKEKMNSAFQALHFDTEPYLYQSDSECSCLVIAIEGIQEIEQQVPRDACIEAISLYCTRVNWLLHRFGGGADMSGDLWEQNGVFAAYFSSSSAAAQCALSMQASLAASKWPGKLKKCSATRPLFSDLQAMTIPIFNGFRMCMSLGVAKITDTINSVVEVVTLDKVHLFERTLSQIVNCIPGTIVLDDLVQGKTKDPQFFGVWGKSIEWVPVDKPSDPKVVAGNAFRRASKNLHRKSLPAVNAVPEQLQSIVFYFMNERLNKLEELKTAPSGKVNPALFESGAFSQNASNGGSKQHVILNHGAFKLLNPTFTCLLRILKRKRLSRDVRKQITRLEQQRLDFEDPSQLGVHTGPGVEFQLADVTLAVESMCDPIVCPKDRDSDFDEEEMKEYKFMYKDDTVGPIKFHQRYMGVKLDRKRVKLERLASDKKSLEDMNATLKAEAEHLRQENAGPLLALHQRIRIFFSMVKQYVAQFDDENSPIMSDDEFIEKFIRTLRQNDPEGILGKEKGRLKEDWSELLHVSLENEKLEKQFSLDLSKLLRSAVGMLCKLFLQIRGAMREVKRQKKVKALKDITS